MGHVDVIRALIARGADIAAPNKAGETPLHLAVMLGQTAAVDTLLESGDPRVLEAATDVGWTPLDYARLDQHPALGDQLRKSVRD
jgi:ankyrin repeat protein